MRPSGLIAKAFGVLPNSSFSAGLVEIVSTTASVSRVDHRDRVAVGVGHEHESPVGRRDDSRRVQADDDLPRLAAASRSTTDTEPSLAIFRTGSTRTGAASPDGPVASPGAGSRPAQLLTYARRPISTTSYGALPTGISRRSLPLAMSISPSVLLILIATNNDLPSRVHGKSDRHAPPPRPPRDFVGKTIGSDRGQLALVRYVEHADVAPGARRIEALAVGREDNSLKASPVRRATDDSRRTRRRRASPGLR